MAILSKGSIYYCLFIICALLCFYHQLSTHQLIQQRNNSTPSTTLVNSHSVEKKIPFEELACKKFMSSANCFEKLAKSDGHHQINQRLLENTLDFSQILLIVTFNWPIYEGAPRIFNLYRHVFGKIVFCGPEDDDGQKFMEVYRSFSGDGSGLPKESLFVGYGRYNLSRIVETDWYHCLPKVIEANPDFQNSYSGVMLLSDDVVFNFWNAKILYSKNFDQIWMNEFISPFHEQPMYPFEVDNKLECRGRTGNNLIDCSGLHFWEFNQRVLEAPILFHNDLQRLSKIDPFYKGFQRNLTRALGGPRRLIGNLVDMVYIPNRLVPTINPIFKLMSK